MQKGWFVKLQDLHLNEKTSSGMYQKSNKAPIFFSS